MPWSEYFTTVVVELYRVHCPDCSVKVEKVPLLPSTAPYSKRFEDAVGEACKSVAARAVVKGKRWLLLSRWVNRTRRRSSSSMLCLP